jgi:hypothetical protein
MKQHKYQKDKIISVSLKISSFEISIMLKTLKMALNPYFSLFRAFFKPKGKVTGTESLKFRVLAESKLAWAKL